jgi:hypothetical protein
VREPGSLTHPQVTPFEGCPLLDNPLLGYQVADLSAHDESLDSFCY